MVVIALSGTSKLVYLRPSNGVASPTLGLEGWANANGSLSEVAMAVDTPVLATLGHFDVPVPEMGKNSLQKCSNARGIRPRNSASQRLLTSSRFAFTRSRRLAGT